MDWRTTRSGWRHSYSPSSVSISEDCWTRTHPHTLNVTMNKQNKQDNQVPRYWWKYYVYILYNCMYINFYDNVQTQQSSTAIEMEKLYIYNFITHSRYLIVLFVLLYSQGLYIYIYIYIVCSCWKFFKSTGQYIYISPVDFKIFQQLQCPLSFQKKIVNKFVLSL